MCPRLTDHYTPRGVKKLVSLGSSKLKQLVDLKPTISKLSSISINHQCQLLGINRSAKCERIYLNAYQSIGELTTDVDDYIEFYNRRRFHETLDYKKPMDVYQESIKLNQEKKKAS